jgi:hypothetical protein
MRRPAPGRAVALAASMLLASASGCLVIFPLDDRPTPGPRGGQAGVSVAPSGGAAGEPAHGEGGAAGQQSSLAGQPSSGSCKTDADCIASKGNGGEAYRCRSSDHTCVMAKSETCPVIRGSFDNPNAIYIGAFATLDAVDPGSSPIVLAQQLALEELSGDGNRGLPGGPSGARRPLVMVVCDNSDELVDAGVTHLIDDLDVPAILATLKPGALLRSFDNHRPSHVFYLSPVSVSGTIADLKDDSLVWNLLGQPSDFVPAYVNLLNRTEKYLHDAGTVAAGDGIRVALVTTKDAFDAELATVLEPALTFNGASIDDNLGKFKGVTLDRADPNLQDEIFDLIRFRPHVIVSAASEVMTMPGGVLGTMEKYWESPTIDGYTQPRPTYLLSPYNAGDLANVGSLIKDTFNSGRDPLPERRFFGLSVASADDSTLLNGFTSRLGIRFKAPNGETNNYYDAFYYLAYAMYGAGTDTPLTGSSIASGMKRLLSGKSYPVGPNSIDPIFSALSGPDSTITLETTLGPPAFDDTTGVRPVDSSFFCFSRADATVTYHPDVRRYDRDQKDFAGSKPLCFTGLMP